MHICKTTIEEPIFQKLFLNHFLFRLRYSQGLPFLTSKKDISSLFSVNNILKWYSALRFLF